MKYIIVINYEDNYDTVGPYTSQALAESTAGKLLAAFEDAGHTHVAVTVVPHTSARAWRELVPFA